MMSVRTKLVAVGNSRGVRIPKVILDQVGLRDEVEIVVETDRIILQPVGHVRAGWDEAFAAMAAHGDDRLLDPELPTSWEVDEWVWP